ncbi:glycerol-3-phosphate dehydrogenase [Parablastomonas sp. CN1-191]|uniref:glycerol-3-phosphate dehydrogenase n=1 Tax=Parablastomonas sp. CN1-191 TaxID=3400908 RepID=UPI003BF783FD
MERDLYDIAVIGGGINGCGIARDAAGRGARVVLLEAGDLACGTSSASTKLIHGGLRYLEYREFALVREALAERERIWGIAPHLVHPLRFILPHTPGLRPRWLLRAGLFLYDHLGGRDRLPKTRSIDLARDPAGQALRPEFRHGFAFSDCWVDDARLVIANARDAAARGAAVFPRRTVTGLARKDGGWTVATEHGPLRARAVINAAGPSVMAVLGLAHEDSERSVRLVRGSHIVVRRRWDGPEAFLFQSGDGRVIFAIPFEDDFTLIGTTDRDHRGGVPKAEPDEIAYLCAAASEYLSEPVRTSDVVWTFSGVRPLVADGSDKPEAATRGYRLELSQADEGAPLLTVFGGKITTYRHLAEAALETLAPRLPIVAGPPWTAGATLPGGDFPLGGVEALAQRLRGAHPFLQAAWALRLARAYGTEAATIFADAATLADCGRHFGHGLTEREVRHLVAREWARSAEDILWRRTKLGLRFSPAQANSLADFLASESTA